MGVLGQAEWAAGRVVVALFVRVFLVRLGCPGEDSSVARDGVDLRRAKRESATVARNAPPPSADATHSLLIRRKVGRQDSIAVSRERLGPVPLDRVEGVQLGGHVL